MFIRVETDQYPLGEAHTRVTNHIDQNGGRVILGGVWISFTFKHGEVLGNRFKILSCLSSGKFAEVYSVQELGSRKIYAMKILKGESGEELSEYTSYSQMLQKSVASLDITNFAYPLEIGKIADFNYQLLPFIEGKDLATILRDGPLPPKKALEIIGKIANVLEQLHNHSIIHGDIKPQNIIVESAKSEIFVIDFGMVQHRKDDVALIFGTLRYMHPILRGNTELLSSETGPAEEFVHATYGAYIDIYSLGVTSLEILAGKGETCLPISERQLVNYLEERNPASKTVGVRILDQLANMLFQMLTVSPNNEGISARTISSICTTLAENISEKDYGENVVKPISESPQNVPEIFKGGKEVEEAIERLESIAHSLDTSTVMMIRTAEKLEMRTTEESDSHIFEELNGTFRNASNRTRTSWRIAMIMTIICFLTIIVMILAAVLLTLMTGAPSWSIVFGGLSVSAVIGTLIWRPYDRVFKATILAQQLEMVYIQTITAFRGSAKIGYRIRICRQAIDMLQTLLDQNTEEKRAKHSS